MSAEAFSVTLWACSAYAAVTPAVGIGNRCCPPSVPRSHILSDFISSPHSPFKSLIRLLLRHIVAGRLKVRRARLPWRDSARAYHGPPPPAAALQPPSATAALLPLPPPAVGGMALQLARRRCFSSLGGGASARSAAALQPPLAAPRPPRGFDYWIPEPGFQYCGTTVIVVPRAGMGQGSPSVRVWRPAWARAGWLI
jgi:hypothetical protein